MATTINKSLLFSEEAAGSPVVKEDSSLRDGSVALTPLA